MAKICILSALLLQLLYTLVQGQNSPCSNHNCMFNFTYIKNPESNKTIGQFVIREPPVNKNLEVRLKMVFKVATQLPTASIVYGYSSRINLTKSEEDASRDVLEGRPLLYRIYFPVQNPLPTVHRIWFNNVQICSGPKASGNVVITITLKHTLRIIRSPQQYPRLYSQSIPRSKYLPWINNTLKIIQSPRPDPQPASPAHVDKIVYIINYNECGISSSSGPNLLISHGKKTLPGQWPWVAAIFRAIYEYEFLCGGTILTTKHVLTAGHCLKRSPRTNETIPANMLSVALGRYKLMDINEQGSVTMNVERYILHPEYAHTVSSNSDLAIIILTSPVEFTAFIRPICLLLPADSRRLEQKDGIIVGWGEDEYGNRYTEEPRLATMSIVRTDVCLRSHPSFFFITSERTFCAGSLHHRDPFRGDSGSGLVIFDSVTGRFHLRGVLSRTPGNQAFRDQTNYIVFVDVFKYLPWINNTLKIIQPPRPDPQPAPPAHVNKIVYIINYNECGISSSSGPNLLISHGKKTLPGQWPWVAAIFRAIYEYEFLCGGTILTTKHVLTAGHCLKISPYTNKTIPANMLSVALGRYKLMDFNEQGSVNMDVARHISHPEYMHTATGDSDLAIIILRSPVEFTAFIRPICLLLPADSRRLEQKDGIIVGWGEDEYGNRYTEEPRLATIPIVRTDVCVQRNAGFAAITSERTFCAGSLNHNGPCNGDSGNSLVIYDSITERYRLRGIVSRTLHGQQPSCHQSEYVVFVDVFKYLYWIYDQMYSS